MLPFFLELHKPFRSRTDTKKLTSQATNIIFASAATQPQLEKEKYVFSLAPFYFFFLKTLQMNNVSKIGFEQCTVQFLRKQALEYFQHTGYIFKCLCLHQISIIIKKMLMVNCIFRKILLAMFKKEIPSNICAIFSSFY